MNYTQIIRDIDSKIDENKIADLHFYSVPIWPLIRKKVYSNALRDFGLSSFNYTKVNIDYIYNVLFGFLVSIYHMLKIMLVCGSCKYLFVGFSRRNLIENAYVDPLFDNLISSLKSSECMMLERPYKGRHDKPLASACPVYYLDAIVYFVHVFKFILAPVLMVCCSRELSKITLSLNEVVEERLSSVSRYSISVTLAAYYLELCCLRLVLFRQRPLVVFIGSRWLNFAFISISKIKESISCEFQHGCILRDSTFYKDINDYQFNVDIMGVYSGAWTNYPWGADKAVVVGKKIIRNDSLIVPNKSLDNEIITNVVVVSQPEMSQKLVSDLSLLSKYNPDVRFVVKLHPQDIDGYKSRYSLLSGFDNISFIEGTLLDLSFSVNYAVGYKSSLLYELHDSGCAIGLISCDEKDDEDYRFAFGDIIQRFSLIRPDQALDQQFLKLSDNDKYKFIDDFDIDKLMSVINEKSV